MGYDHDKYLRGCNASVALHNTKIHRLRKDDVVSFSPSPERTQRLRNEGNAPFSVDRQIFNYTKSDIVIVDRQFNLPVRIPRAVGRPEHRRDSHCVIIQYTYTFHTEIRNIDPYSLYNEDAYLDKLTVEIIECVKRQAANNNPINKYTVTVEVTVDESKIKTGVVNYFSKLDMTINFDDQPTYLHRHPYSSPVGIAEQIHHDVDEYGPPHTSRVEMIISADPEKYAAKYMRIGSLIKRIPVVDSQSLQEGFHIWYYGDFFDEDADKENLNGVDHRHLSVKKACEKFLLFNSREEALQYGDPVTHQKKELNNLTHEIERMKRRNEYLKAENQREEEERKQRIRDEEEERRKRIRDDEEEQRKIKEEIAISEHSRLLITKVLDLVTQSIKSSFGFFSFLSKFLELSAKA